MDIKWSAWGIILLTILIKWCGRLECKGECPGKQWFLDGAGDKVQDGKFSRKLSRSFKKRF